jgi:hypothetical protein
MGYIGPGLEFGAFQKIDDISSGFNGSATQFNVQIGGTTAEIASLNQLIISISGVIQEPNSAFTFGSSRSTIAFTGPPAATDTFFGILLGNSFDAGTPADASIGYNKLTTINGVYRNVQTLTQNLTLAASDNALVAGPFTVQSGSTLTVPSGATFVIV